MTHGNDGKRNAAKPAADRADAHLHIRVKLKDLRLWYVKSKRAGVPLTQWVIKQLNQEEK